MFSTHARVCVYVVRPRAHAAVYTSKDCERADMVQGEHCPWHRVYGVHLRACFLDGPGRACIVNTHARKVPLIDWPRGPTPQCFLACPWASYITI